MTFCENFKTHAHLCKGIACVQEKQGPPRQGITTFFVHHCPLVKAYDTCVDALVDTWPRPTYSTNTGKYHFILMAMEVHNMFRHDMDCFIRECVHLFHDKQSRGYLSLSLLHLIFQAMCQYCFSACFNLCYRKKDCIGGRYFSKPPMTIRSHDLYESNI